MQISTEHITFKSEGLIKRFLAPLNIYSGITYFSYGVNYPDSRGFTLLTHTNYYKKMLENQYPFWGFYLGSGWHTWNKTLTLAQKDSLANNNLGNGIIYVDHQEEKTIVVEFGTQLQNHQIMNFYLNELDFLKKYICSFEKQAAYIIDQAKNQLILPHLGIREIKESKFTPNIPFLSKRELQLLQYLVKGYSMSNICDEMSLSLSSLNKCVARLKQKLNCHSRMELLKKTRELRLIQSATL